VLQERKIRRVGGNREREIDVRIIAATSLDLEKEIREERFRMDLYHRINVAQVDLPPLRKRVEDIPLLVSHFLELQSWQLKRDSIEMDPEALEVLKYYHWPGNVRELQNVLKKTLVMTQNNPIGVEDLPDDIITAAGDYSESESAGFFELRDQHIADFEKQYFAELLEVHKGDVTKAAEQAKIPRGTMYRLLKKNNFDPADFRP
jgi:DNA-binding NtrC family response regulator